MEVIGTATTSYLKIITQEINKMTLNVSQLLNVYCFYYKYCCRVRENKILESILLETCLGNQCSF